MISSGRISLTFRVNPPGGSVSEAINISGYGRNWELQKEGGGKQYPVIMPVSSTPVLMDDDGETLYDDGLSKLNE
jgi:hypothetical protein